nr:hypothetical protein B0A51_14440 [Rachicladosporium sp. CCFEE 5018]
MAHGVAGAGGVLYALYYAIDRNSYLTLLLISTQAILAINLAMSLCTTALTLVVILSQGVQSCIRGWRSGEGVTDVSQKAPGEVEAGKGLLAAIREAWKAAEKAFQGGANSGVERPPGYSAVPAVETAV